MGIVTGAIFSESELRAVAQALGDTETGLTNGEIDELLQLSGVADELGPATKWKRIFVNLWNRQARDGHRKACLAFVRKAMKPERYLRQPERFGVMRDSLNKALSFAGLEMDEAGELHRAGRVHTLSEAERRARELRSDLQARCASIRTCLRFAAPSLWLTTTFTPCRRRPRASSTSCAG